MCIVAIAWQVFEKMPLVLLSNRDEFLDRPTLPAHQWQDLPIFAGRDELSGGSWLGFHQQNHIPNHIPSHILKNAPLPDEHASKIALIESCPTSEPSSNDFIKSANSSSVMPYQSHQSGKWAVVLNFRDGEPKNSEHTSRGHLVSDFLISDLSPMAFAKQIALTQYAGFNLIVGDDTQAVLINNRGYPPTALHAGLHVISNGQPTDEWIKCERLRTKVYQEVLPLISQGVDTNDWQKVAFTVLSDTLLAPDDKLPTTGMPVELEKALSSIYIKHDRLKNYGTRTQSILTLTKTTKSKTIVKEL